MKYFIFSFLLFCTCASVSAQDFGKAILINKPKTAFIGNEDTLNQILIKTLKRNAERDRFILYDWVEGRTVRLMPEFAGKEKPVETVVFLSQIYNLHQNASLQITTDTTGKITSSSISKAFGAHLTFKAIDVATSRILRVQNSTIIPSSGHSIPVDLNKEFGVDASALLKSNKKKYDELAAKLVAKYEPKMTAHILEVVKKSGGAFNEQATAIRYLNPKHFDVVIPDVIDGKTKEIAIKAGTDDDLFVGQDFDVYAKRKLDQYHYYDHIARVMIKEATAKTALAKTHSLFGKAKDLTEALENKDELILLPMNNGQNLNEYNWNGKTPRVNLAVKKTCMNCAVDTEKSLLASSAINLIERNAPQLTYFNNLLKNEAFVDYSVEDLQGKKIGSQLVVSIDNNQFTAIDVSSGVTVISKVRTGYDKWWGSTITLDEISMMLSEYNPKLYSIQFLKVIEEKKEKVEKILVFNPVGSERAERFDIVTTAEEVVDGETMYRNNKIGEAKLGKSYSKELAEMKVTDGEKEVFAAVKAGTKFRIIHRIKQ